jgi:NADH dehydrogenase FAD-containing subunit
MVNVAPTRILVLGGGFAGLTVAIEGKKLGRNPAVEVTLINRDNFPCLPPCFMRWQWISQRFVNPVRKILRHVHFFARQVERTDLGQRTVVITKGYRLVGHQALRYVRGGRARAGLAIYNSNAASYVDGAGTIGFKRG